ncbi:MAG: UDP-glucuronic acid dehydrogenase [Proteobacteria bacterium]|nr:UDP-glucuronic acid dehydrogenase [Pseudomonadota bacterium]MBU1709843.1 UDP-glucuronic acid dehydrogenase [Pseudomonadota bacterium]
MRISILCSKGHPVTLFLKRWQKENSDLHSIELVNAKHELLGGDILFLISCHEIIGLDIRSMYQKTLVIHASDLPRGRGWSPLVWQILEGHNCITVSLLEAEDAVDSGKIWTQKKMYLEGHELYNEINDQLFQIELDLLSFAVDNLQSIKPRQQEVSEATYYTRRNPGQSKLDTMKSIADQFDLLRISDPQRYPAFFDFAGHRYKIEISKITIEEE